MRALIKEAAAVLEKNITAASTQSFATMVTRFSDDINRDLGSVEQEVASLKEAKGEMQEQFNRLRNDYMLLAAVKAGRVSPITEKRLNCSINTWLRGPGITTFCALCVACWMHPHELTAPDEKMPWYFFVPVIFIIFFNGQYYAQRVIGNYYIRKAQDYHKRGIYTVDLHAS